MGTTLFFSSFFCADGLPSASLLQSPVQYAILKVKQRFGLPSPELDHAVVIDLQTLVCLGRKSGDTRLVGKQCGLGAGTEDRELQSGLQSG